METPWYLSNLFPEPLFAFSGRSKTQSALALSVFHRFGAPQKGLGTLSGFFRTKARGVEFCVENVARSNSNFHLKLKVAKIMPLKQGPSK